MAHKKAQATWTVEETPQGRRIRLSGHWNLLTRLQDKRKIARQFETLAAQPLIWDLQNIDALDGEGALVLWHTWGGKLPQHLLCRADQKQWFERLANLPPMPPPPKWSPLYPLEILGKKLLTLVRDVSGIFILIGQLMLDFGYTVSHPRLIPWTEISAGVYKIGASSMLLLGAMGFLVGMVMTYQVAESLVHYGANTLIVNVLGLAMMRELGPVSASLIVMARSGSSITAGIGAMHIADEILALRAFGASPTQRLILPKVIAMIVTVPLLVVWTDFMGMLGGVITTDFTLGIGYKYFLQALPESVPWVNFWIGLGKGVLFGFLIATVASYFGLKIRSSTESLSQQTTNSVVTGLSLIIVIDAFSGSLLTNVGLYQ